jgi:hypothetical protein
MAISAYKDVIVFPNDNSGRVNIKEQAFTASGTWTAPSGVTAAQVILVGAGGGGGGGSDASAGGGGAGGVVAVQNINVTPGTSYQLNIGAGGQGGQTAITSYGDYLSTLPGANGGTTTFGSTTVWNYLTNPDFDYNVLGWDPEVLYRGADGLSGATTITVYPNTSGLVQGMYVSGTNLGANTQVVSVAGNVVTLSVANASTVQGIVTFDIGDTVLTPANTIINAINSVGIDAVTGTNTFAVNTPGSPYTQLVTGSTGQTATPAILSNNLVPPRLAQLEDPSLISSGFVTAYGTNPATISVTSAGLPGKITPEMTAGISTAATANNGATTITVSNPFGIYANMNVFTVSGTGIAAGTYVLSVQGTSVTLSAATTAQLTATTVYFSYNATVGQQALLATTGAAVSQANPTWINFTSIVNNTNNTGSSSYVGGYQGIPWIPGATYTVSAYVSSNVNVLTTTPIIFQLRSAGTSYMAQSNINYLGGTTIYTPNTNTIDAATGNGFFVRQATAAAMNTYGASVSTTAAGTTSATTQLTVASATGIYVGMTVTGVGVTNSGSTVVSAITGTLVTLSAASSINSGTSITFAMPTGVQILGSTVTTGQTGWRRVYATITTPNISPTSTAATTGIYGLGSSAQFIYPTIVLEQANTSFWFDNLQVELGSTPTTWQPPVFQQVPSLSVSSQNATGGNFESAHRPVRITASSAYAGSMYLTALGTANSYYPVTAFIEWLDVDYNVISRSIGANNFLGIAKVATTTQTGTGTLVTAYPVRVGVSATSPSTAYYARLGFSAYQGTTPGTTTVIYNMFFPVLEAGVSFTQPKRPDGVNYFWAGQPGASQLISAWTLAAEGGGGGGAYNTNNRHWQFGLEGGNNGGHAAVNSYAGLTLAGGGGGSYSVGMPGQAWGQTTNGSTSSQVGASTLSTAGLYSHTFPVRGNLGGFSHTDSGPNSPYISAQGGDGGLGTIVSGLTSGSPLGLALGGGGGGGGWGSAGSNLTYPGRGNGGGGKGGGTYIVDEYNNQYYFSRGLDATPNTGGGGGGAGGNQQNSPFGLLVHTAASNTLSMENWSQDNYKWVPLYNAAVSQAGTPANVTGGTYGMSIVVGDSGSAKVATAWQEFPILPRTILWLQQFGTRLQTAPSGVTSPLYPGLSKRVRPTVRWKDQNNAIIREDRPSYDAIFTATTTNTYLGATAGNTTVVNGWATLQAPTNAYFFDVTIELDYFDGGDVVYVDFGTNANSLYYLPYIAQGGNGADGYALVRWFDKTSL